MSSSRGWRASPDAQPESPPLNAATETSIHDPRISYYSVNYAAYYHNLTTGANACGIKINVSLVGYAVEGMCASVPFTTQFPDTCHLGHLEKHLPVISSLGLRNSNLN
ncbi:hypothetical protein EYR41_002494 [Orbilia oligospora]|uniref:Uncharacterized protein n=1 Tax=Orbilia oligospora TaxID=2813651 RepID=A0A7C8JVA1_ORBOL|nr:hypothetical protein TWF751_003629 [Orbilia oligospora]TGJ62520.1 hypothetical protein EYR41_002494 [Orbilia oligospora]